MKYRLLFPGQRVPEWLCKVTPPEFARIGGFIVVTLGKPHVARLLFPSGCVIRVKNGTEGAHIDLRFVFHLDPIIPRLRLPDWRGWVIRKLGGRLASEYAELQDRYESLESVFEGAQETPEAPQK